MPDTYINPERITDPYPAIAAGKLGKPEQLGATAQTLSLATEVSEIAMAGGSNINYALPDGVSGQTHTVVLTAKGGAGNAVITSANFVGGTGITLDTVGEFFQVKWLAGKWRVIANTGALA
jgi:hypothetical protein